jgi:hypothetical protein
MAGSQQASTWVGEEEFLKLLKDVNHEKPPASKLAIHAIAKFAVENQKVRFY